MHLGVHSPSASSSSTGFSNYTYAAAPYNSIYSSTPPTPQMSSSSSSAAMMAAVAAASSHMPGNNNAMWFSASESEDALLGDVYNNEFMWHLN